MKDFKDMKLGDEIPKKYFGEFKDLFTGKVRLLKITYTLQGEEGVTADIKLEHKDFVESEK